MDMQIYLSEIEYAATDFISLIWKETEAAVQLEAELKRLTEATGRDYGQVESLALMDDDDDNLATGLYWDTYFGVDKERHHKAEDVGAAGDRIALHEFSVSVAAGSVLQCAKQGLSMVYQEPARWPKWTAIGTQDFGNIIRHARNQAMHWETPLGNSVEKCFQQMAIEISLAFNNYQTQSLAFEVVNQLGWKTFSKFRTDMLKV